MSLAQVNLIDFRLVGDYSCTYLILYMSISVHEFILMTGKLALPTLIVLCSIALGRPVQSSIVVMGIVSAVP